MSSDGSRKPNDNRTLNAKAQITRPKILKAMNLKTLKSYTPYIPPDTEGMVLEIGEDPTPQALNLFRIASGTRGRVRNNPVNVEFRKGDYEVCTAQMYCYAYSHTDQMGVGGCACSSTTST